MSAESPKTISIHTEYIELYQALKLEGLASSGGEAKQVIVKGMVEVNGQADTRKRAKLRPDDTFSFQGETYRIVPSTAGNKPS